MDGSSPRSIEPFRQLLADMVLWLALVLLFLVFRATLLWIFRGELSQQPSGQSLLRCFETGLRSDTTAATWALLRLTPCVSFGLGSPTSASDRFRHDGGAGRHLGFDLI